MANAKGAGHAMQLKPITVPMNLVEGYKFIKWDDDTGTGMPVVLKVDKKGFFLYWTDNNGDTEFLEISSIRDTRTGKYAKTPRNEGKLKESITIGPNEISLEDKTVTVVYGPDFVNVNFINFCTNSKTVAETWTNEILKMAYNLLSINGSVYTFLEKAHTKLTLLMRDRDGRLPVKNAVKMFASHKDDKKRIEKSLEACDLPSGKSDTILPERINLEKFFNFYKHLVGRSEVMEIFDIVCKEKVGDYIECSRDKLMNVDQFVDFLNKEQRDPRLNEILYPYANRSRAMDLIGQYELNKELANKGRLSFDGFLRYLLSDDNAIVPPEKFDLNSDMDQALNHYFINSSHNTYLTGHQLTGKSSVEIYRQCLLAGCRCIELDCWNGRSDDEPIITHGYTVVTDVPLKEVLEAISESAFKTSLYPVILSFENHCSSKQQAKMAQYCRKIFGEMLLTEPLSSHPLDAGVPLPSPNHLLRKIIIKNKKKHKRLNKTNNSAALNEESQTVNSPVNVSPSNHEFRPELMASNSDDSNQGAGENDDLLDDNEPNTNSNIIKNSSCDIEEPDSDSSLEDDDVNEEHSIADPSVKEPEAGSEMSELVIYVQPIRFHAFDYAERRNRSFEVSSFDETQSTSLLKERPIEFVNYNKRQLSRIYPRGTRVNSSNYMPQIFWNAGCQMVALNFQTLDLGMQLNLGIFEYNGRNGYLLKPDFMRRQDRRFDPFTESTVDGIIAGTVSIKIISGQFLSDKRVGTYVEVDMYGLPADTQRRKRTKIVPANGLNPIYDEEVFVFKKVVLPDLACLRIAAFEENGKFIGTRILPVVGLRPGYRHISLRNESLQPLTLPTLFVHITVKDYVPDGLSELADALANPIKYQSMVEKHANQLLALADDVEDTPMCNDTNLSSRTASMSEARMFGGGGGFGAPGGDDDSLYRPYMREVSTDSNNVQPYSSRAEISKVELNGGSSKSSSKVSSPNHKSFSIKRQDTLNRRMTASLKIHEDNVNEKSASLLESDEAHPQPESIEKLKMSKNVQKIVSKFERDLAALHKKYDKLREKGRENYLQEEDKVNQMIEKQKKLANNTSKGIKKSLDSMKRQSLVDVQAFEEERLSKLKELKKVYSDSILGLFIEEYKEEFRLFEQKYYDQYCHAMGKAIEDSQNLQLNYLNNLHDKEVQSLMKRLEVQNKEELVTLSKTHKDKNELARIKRELQQKMIVQAVDERTKYKTLLTMRTNELKERNTVVKEKFEEEKRTMIIEKRKEYENKCDTLNTNYKLDSAMFAQRYLAKKEGNT